MTKDQLIRAVITTIISTLILSIISYFWKYVVKLLASFKKLPNKALTLLIAYIHNFPYRIYNKNKFKLTKIRERGGHTYYIKIYHDSREYAYKREIQDEFHHMIYRHYRPSDTAQEAVGDIKYNVEYTKIGEIDKSSGVYRIPIDSNYKLKRGLRNKY